MDLEEGVRQLYPYAAEFGALHEFPERGMPRERLLEELRSMAVREDRKWESGRCSGTMYCGDHEHYAFLNEAYGLFSHVNALQRDLCPSMNRMESEIVAMTVALLHGEAVQRHDGAHRACGALSLGGTESILNATLAYREKARAERGIERPRMIWPASAHPAFRKAAHLFGFDVTVAPIDPVTMQVDADFVRDAVDANTVMLVGSACNYPYGTIDPIGALSAIAVEKDVWLHVDGCLGGWMLPWGEALGYPDIPAFDFRLPGVTSISADTHKFGYGPKGGSVLGVARRELSAPSVFSDDRLGGRRLWLAGVDGQPLGRPDRGDVGGAAQPRARRLPCAGEGDLRDGLRHAGRGARDSGAARARQADVLLRVHLGRVRHLSRERFHAAARLALQRASASGCAAHVRDGAADAAGRRRAVPAGPGRSGRACTASCARAAAVERRLWRRCGGARFA
ncbi:putative sphingosine-1-phosphate lyase [Burkholderia pseudomallei]|uniref:pyridoxal phosphate-dependent decarboxylase family protein n=1 Tax=Burkholderia pseudomallei TaxID=28450 RepID=UPI00050E8C55|nr:pyridoxal-dependent decarboxylase [Burkholderia pseudomallei]KGC23865.1 putative sphingosine-1-phosphate lyase [Burkholderia pseudomallei]